MSHVLKVIEILAESDQSWEDAAQKAVERACQKLDGVKSIYIRNFASNSQAKPDCSQTPSGF